MQTARLEPNLLLHHVGRFFFPGELLDSLDDQVIVQWAALWRQECLLSGLQTFQHRTQDPPLTSQWLDQWIARTQWSRNSSQLAPLMDNGDGWSKLRAVHYAKDEILRLCDPQRRVRLSQNLLCAVLFDQEILTLTEDVKQPILPPDKLRCHVRLLRKHS